TQPFVVAVLADLHGEAAAEERELPPLSERKFCAIDQDNRDQRIKLMRPMIYVEGEESPLQFSSLDDFDPLGIAQLHQGCRVLLAQRTALADAHSLLVAHSDLIEPLKALLQTPSMQGTDPPEWWASSELDLEQARAQFTLLLDESRALRLAEQPDLVAALYERMRTLDEALGYEVTRVLRDPEFRRLEAAWRGVDHLLRHLGTYEQSQLYVLTIGRGELEKGLQVDGAIQHWLMEEFAQFGGQPKAVLVLDFEFMQQPRDVAILAAVARLAAMVNVQVLASAAPGLLDADDDAVI